MRTGVARTLLLILLLVLAGQASAAPCDSGGDMSMPVDMTGDHQSHCAPGADGDHAAPGCGDHGGDCEPNCGCCPGHCAGALPAGDTKAMALRANSAATGYRELNSSPEPEAALRPPIRGPIPN